jgi:ABC-type branched-subunit amino acid transport system substrate-binding protein
MRRFCSIIVATLLATAVIGVQAITSAEAAGGGRPGVSGNEIKVGGIASPPNVLNVPYEDGFAGAKAYFDMINSKGGVFGKKFKVVAQLSDQASPSGNIQAAKSLIAKKVFAIVPVSTNSFASGFLLSKGSTPAFGYNIDAGYCGTNSESTAIGAATPDLAGANGKFSQCPRKNVFGQVGSFLCFACPSISPAVLAKQLGVKNGAILTYTHPSSTACGDGDQATFKKYGINIAYQDRSLQFGFADASSAVQAMKKANVDYVVTCMDFGGAYKISQEMRQAGMTGIKFYAPEGYRESTIQKYGKQLDGWYFRIGFTPWESKPQPKGTKAFLTAMKKAGIKPSEQAQAGWMNAQLLVAGIKLAGKNFTQQSVVDAINGITNWTADGMVPPINWSTDGHGPGHEACDAYVKAQGGKFVPVFGKPGQPFVCYPDNPQPADLNTPYYRPLKAGETVPGATATPSTP